VLQRFSKFGSVAMGPCFRRDDIEWRVAQRVSAV
jgi:hypothetical protein